MNFTQIYHGMVGRDFIKAFNDNFTIADTNLVDILATLIYKIKSTDIKEFKVIDNVVSYTLEEAPTEGEDNRTWVPVDITQWGNINGNIEDQEDLWNILQDKAAVETVDTLSNLLSTLSSNFETVRGQVETNVTNIRTNTNDVADILEALTEKVNSTNIKAIRLNNAVFQWSPDGRTWYEQPATTSIAWGHLIGDITAQEDLMEYFENIQNAFTALDGTITDINNSISSLRTDLNTLDSALDIHIEEYNAYKSQVSDSLSEMNSKVVDAKETADGAQDNLDNHLTDYDNPHHITKATIGLSNVDNTSDMNKPVSYTQRNYIAEQIAAVQREIADTSGLVFGLDYASFLFVGNQADYDNTISKEGVLAFILDDEYFDMNIILLSSNYSDYELYKDGVKLNATTVTASSKIYRGLPRDNSSFVVKVGVNGETKSYNISPRYAETNNINVDSLVEGGDE